VIIDAHQHVWDLTRADYPWLTPELGDLHRTITQDEIEPTLDRLGIDGTVLVEAADNAKDTQLMRDTAAAHGRVLAIVAWAPLDRPEELPSLLHRLRAEPLVVGVRNLIHNLPPRWLEQPAPDRAIGLLARADLTLDFVTSSAAALEELPRIGARHPDLRVVIDHLGKPPIGGTRSEHDDWLALITAAAANPLTHAKLSGLYSAVGTPQPTVEAVRPFVEEALELFGPDRLMYGGDWPISELAGGYEHNWLIVAETIAALSPPEQANVLGGTAARFYGIHDPRMKE
jgi:L-fuconolactonase